MAGPMAAFQRVLFGVTHKGMGLSEPGGQTPSLLQAFGEGLLLFLPWNPASQPSHLHHLLLEDGPDATAAGVACRLRILPPPPHSDFLL